MSVITFVCAHSLFVFMKIVNGSDFNNFTLIYLFLFHKLTRFQLTDGSWLSTISDPEIGCPPIDGKPHLYMQIHSRAISRSVQSIDRFQHILIYMWYLGRLNTSCLSSLDLQILHPRSTFQRRNKLPCNYISLGLATGWHKVSIAHY